MENLEPYVFIKKIQGDDKEVQIWIDKMISMQNSVNSSNNEGFLDVRSDKESLYANYYAIQSEYELIYDENNHDIMSEKFKKVVKAEVIVVFKSKVIIIWGKQSLVKKVEHNIEKSTDFKVTLKNIKLSYKKCIDIIENYEFSIRNITFNNLSLLGSSIKSISIEVPTNNEAYNIINKIGTSISKIDIDIILNENEKLTLKINFRFGVIKTEFKILSMTNIELSKELVNRMCLCGGE